MLSGFFCSDQEQPIEVGYERAFSRKEVINRTFRPGYLVTTSPITKPTVVILSAVRLTTSGKFLPPMV